MKEHTLELLQYKRVCKDFSQHAITEEGKVLCENIKPTSEISKIENIKSCGNDCFSLLKKSFSPPLKYLPPIMPFLEKLSLGEVLEIEGIYAVFLLTILTRNIVNWKDEVSKNLFEKNSFLEKINDLPNLDEIYFSIFSFIDENGSLKEVPSLRAISRKIEEAESEIRTSMLHYFNDANFSDMLQSNIPTTKNNRQVIAIKANFKGRIKGIIHEYSHSAKTFYIEPEDIVLKNNQLQELKVEWEKEYFSILRRLSNVIFENNESLKLALSIVKEIDLIFAFAKWAILNQANFLMEEGKTLKLKDARHPLVSHCTPLNIIMQESKNVLIITGANAGGKTVALKTVALLSLMNQTGMPLPIDCNSSLPYFDFIGVDIGDEQSIDKACSTFSSQIKNISSIINEATDKSLVIFDEMGSGTDVEEGGAIAMAILDEMIERKTLTLISTHHGALKKYGFSNSNCLNASVEFDSKTLLPTYNIIVGVPGESHAIEVASLNGLKNNIIEKAKEYLSNNSSRISFLINNLIEKQTEIDELKEKLKNDEKKVIEKLRECELKMLSLKQKELELKKGAIKDARRLFNEKKKEIEGLVRHVREGKISREDTVALKTWISSVDEALASEKEAINIEEDKLEQKLNPSSYDEGFEDIKVGDAVYSTTYDMEGVVLHFEKKEKALVAFNNVTLKVPIKDLRCVKRSPEKSTIVYEISRDDSALFELKILGLRSDEAIKALNEHFDKVLLYNIREFSIVHGKGNGILQEIVHDMLKKSKYVKDFCFARPEFGGTGKTLVTLK
ncbi:MAG: endonuclease MutS2 [Treponema sp.]